MLLVYVPCKDEDEAKTIARSLVEKKLACCTNIIPKITSIYPWDGEVKEESEALLLIKTNSEYDEVKNHVEELHSYAVPLISSVKLTNVNEKYAAWSEGVQE